MYRVEKAWLHKGNICVVLHGDIGHRCGYVGVGKEHPLYKLPYSSHSDILAKRLDQLKSEPIGKRGIIPLMCWDGRTVSPEIAFDVHGGLTYSGDSPTYPIPVLDREIWWFGYDCGHAGDGSDLDVVDSEVRKIKERYPNSDPVRSLEYCIQECESLSDQLAALVE